MHPAGQGVPRLEPLDVDRERRVAAAAGLRARPLRGGDHRHRAGLGVGEGDPLLLRALGEVVQLLADPLAPACGSPATASAPLVVPEKRRMASAILRRCRSAGRPSPAPPSITPLLRGQSLDLLLEPVGDVLDREAQRVGQRADGRELVGDRGVVPLDHREGRHRLAGHRHLAASASRGRRRRAARSRPGCRAAAAPRPGRGGCRGGCWPARRSARAISVEGLEVGRGLPRRVDRRAERVHERVHVGGGQVVLLVPGGRRQHDVGQQGGRRHPEVGRQQQVELALRRVVAPGDVRGPRRLGVLAWPSRWSGCRAGA